MALKATALCAFAVVVAAASTACSSSSSNGSTPSGDGGGGGGGGGSYCPKIPIADIQALQAPASYGAVAETDMSPVFECDSGGLQIQLQTDDTDKSLYYTASGTAADAGPNVHPVSGVGDEAYWEAGDDGSGHELSVPTFLAHKGTATCNISTDNDPTHYSMPYNTASPVSINAADAAAWATKAGQVCIDFFSAAGS